MRAVDLPAWCAKASIAACLTGLMILLFLRLVAEHADRRHLDPAVDPGVDLACSTLLGQTLNVMTLGGLALAVGILVDDATVEIENNHRHMDMGKPIRQAILDGAAEVATPAFVATLSICIVFVPIFLLTGVGGFLFAPLAMAVVFAMLASYLLSRTLVPTMFWYLMPAEERAREARASRRTAAHRCFGRIVERLRGGLPQARPTAYEGTLDWMLEHRRQPPWWRFLAFAMRVAGALSVRRPRLLPDRRRRTAPAPRAVPARHADRADRDLFPAGRGLHPPGHPGRRRSA